LKMTLNGKEVTFEQGKTILEIAKAHDIYIPSLCYHPKTGPLSRCRLCVVDVQGMRGLQTACSTPATDGMVVRTDTEEIRAAQKMVVNLVLSDGQHQCLACEANGDCELQNAAYYLGIEVPEFVVDLKFPEIDDSSEMIVFDHRKCIKCGRCIEADNHTVVNEVLDFGFRGHNTKVMCDDDLPMGQSSCVQCGECVQICPVGAIIDKKAIGKGRTWSYPKWIRSARIVGLGVSSPCILMLRKMRSCASPALRDLRPIMGCCASKAVTGMSLSIAPNA